ncbi:MAG: NADH-dependent [FeFe] hydrogenase, group A6 [Spirochaetaceae bacterium]
MITLLMNDKSITVEDGTSVLNAAKQAGVEIPTLCHHQDLEPRGSCGMCMVDIEGQAGYKRACVTEARDGMHVRTNTAALRTMRRGLLELVLATHPEDCLACIKHGKCELQNLAEKLEVRALRYEKTTRGLPVDRSSMSIVRDMNKCIGCGRCVEVCNDVQSVGSIFFQGRGSETVVAPADEFEMGSSPCVNCGQCVVYCPVGALYEREDIDAAWSAIDDPAQTVVAQMAPAVRVALGEEFGLEPGTLVTGKVYAALRELGVDVVLDTNFSADLTIMEEGTEFLERLEHGGPFPLITSCSPGWIKFAETYYDDLLDNVSSCKSPQQMLGAVIKSYYADEKGIDQSHLTSLSVMPCTAKKFEAGRPGMASSGRQDVDIVLTTREVARMMRQAGINFDELSETEPDELLSAYSGAATIFGSTGGVMEAALRSAYELKTGERLERVELAPVRGTEGVRAATIDVAGTPIRVAVAHGLENARTILDEVRAAKRRGEIPYHFIEVMACAGGCVGGGGQPLENSMERRRQRAAGLYAEDSSAPIRRSHENPEVLALYEQFLGRPGSARAHELLHTEYRRRNPYAPQVFDAPRGQAPRGRAPTVRAPRARANP